MAKRERFARPVVAGPDGIFALGVRALPKCAVRLGSDKGLMEVAATSEIRPAPGNDMHAAHGFARQQPPAALRVLVYSTVFPNPVLPLHGTFVFERVRHLAALADIRVMAPVAWYRALGRQVPLPHVNSRVEVSHPRFWYVPKFFMAPRGLCLFLSTVRAVGRLRKEFDFDLIDAHFAYPDGFAAILLGRWFRRPVCITLRGTIIMISQRPLGRMLCDWAIRRAERVIAVAENLADRAREGGVAEARIETIANGVDTERFRLVEQVEARRRLGLPEKDSLFVSVGHLSPRKGFHRVIRALPRVLQSCPDARLAIVGGGGAEGDNRAELAALANELGIADRVLFVGPKPPDEVALWLAAADAFVLASDFEGCPNVVLEAMACGRPVIATKVGDVERMVPPFAGILLDDPDDRSALAESLLVSLRRHWDEMRIRDHVAVRSWDEVARRAARQWVMAVESYRSTEHGAATGSMRRQASLLP
jgi:teichuronic acid biosynthesis glycosyltransferase TuaC